MCIFKEVSTISFLFFLISEIVLTALQKYSKAVTNYVSH